MAPYQPMRMWVKREQLTRFTTGITNMSGDGMWRLENLSKALGGRALDSYQAVRTALEAVVMDHEYGFYAYQWIDYHNAAKCWRIKCCHDIRLKDGREFEGYSPNGNGWHGSHGRFDDAQVSHIRISKKQMGDE